MGRSNDAYAVPKTTAQRLDVQQRRPREKFTDASEIEQAFELAAVTLKPEELSGRQLIHRLMPSLYALRKKGFSFVQIARVFNEAVGGTARLQVATLKAYYNEFIVERLDECEEKLREAVKVTAQVEKLTSKSAQVLVAEAVELKTSMMAGKNSAAERLIGAQTQRAALTGGMGIEASQPPPPAAEKKEGPPAEAAKSPSATGGNAQIKGEGGVGSAPYFDLDEIPIPSAPSARAVGTKEEGAQIQNAPGADSELNHFGAQNPNSLPLVCTTEPTPETIHPTNSDTFDGVPQIFFSESVLEHPAIPGLMLTKAQRMYNNRLRYTSGESELIETVPQMGKRVKWRKAQKQSESRTQNDFVAMNTTLFQKPG